MILTKKPEEENTAFVIHCNFSFLGYYGITAGGEQEVKRLPVLTSLTDDTLHNYPPC